MRSVVLNLLKFLHIILFSHHIIGILSKPQLGKLKSFTYPNQTKNQLI